MRSLFPPVRPLDTLPRRVLVLAPHSDDEVIGCGGVLAFHAGRGDAVRVVVLTDGAAGDPGGGQEDVVAARRREAAEAGRCLGITDHRFAGLPDGGLSANPDLVPRIAAELAEFGPELVYAPSPQEMHADHRATARALVRALASANGSATSPKVLFYGVNAQVQASVVFDTTPFWDRKRAALERFASQLAYHDLVAKCDALDRARTVNIEDRHTVRVEGFAELDAGRLSRYHGNVTQLIETLMGPESNEGPRSAAGTERPAVTAVISTWNKADVVLENIRSLENQTVPFESIVVVDNASTDGTAERIAAEHPNVRLIVMPHSRYGACETFNIGFASVTTPLLAILDDDITLPPDWVQKTVDRLAREPETTAIVSTKVVEPGMPASYAESPSVNRERYMSTFRGCGSLARTEALREAGFYDERLFIYGNERDLTCRLLNLGYRVLQYPEAITYHKTPFGIQMGKRSLYFHARNAWLSMLKYAPLEDLLRMPFLVFSKVLLRRESAEEAGGVSDAVGTIGIGRSLRATPGAAWILAKAVLSVLWNVPYCLKRRQPVTAPDFELPLR